MVKNLRPVSGEVSYQRSQFYESLSVQGIPCKIYSIKSNLAYDGLYGDLEVSTLTHEESFNTYITYDTMPTISVLKSLGWYQPVSEGLPVIAHIPVLYQDSEGSLTEFTPKLEDVIELSVHTESNLGSTRTQSYLIKDLQAAGFPYVIYYIAKLVPYRENVTPINQTSPLP